MNIFQSVRALFGQSVVAEEWQPVDELQKAIDEHKVAQFELTKAQQEFDQINRDYALKFQACDTLIEKGYDVGKTNKQLLTQRLDGITDDFLNNTKQLIDSLTKAEQSRVQLESDMIAKAIQVVAQLDQQDQDTIKDIIDVWQETGLVKGEEVSSQAKAITLAIEEIVKGGIGSGRYDHHKRKIAEHERERNQILREQENDPDIHAEDGAGGRATDSYGKRLNEIDKKIQHHRSKINEIKDKQKAKEAQQKIDAENAEKERIANWDRRYAEAHSNISKGGEGSRGGKVIGHTKSGKPIYEIASHEGHKDFTEQDHKDARAIHEKKALKHYDTLHTAGVSVNKRRSAGQKHQQHMRQADAHMDAARGSEIKKSHEPIAIEIAGIEEIVKGGEGSRGGKIIGHTKSGKPIYDTFHHPGHESFTIEDHKDAVDAHERNRLSRRVGNPERARHKKAAQGLSYDDEKGWIKKSHEPIAIELAGKGDVVYDSPVEGHYANVIIKDKDKILFLKRASNKTVEPNKYCLPGGHIDEGETVEQAACRELKEEANIDCSSCYIIGKAKCADGKWAFYLQAHPQFNDVALLDGESVNAHWMSRDEWIAADLIFDLKEHLVAIETSSQSIDKIPNILKKGEDEVEMPWKEFVKEHNRLLDILENGTEQQRKAEAKRQRKEMAKYKDEGVEKGEQDDELEKAIDDDNPFYYDNQEELIKGRAAAEGEERTWGGKKYKKQGGKWLPVGSGKEKGSDEILGKTKSGKAIYNDASHEEHKNFSIKEHREASSAHVEKYKQLKDSDKKKAEHHLDQSIEHRKAADKKETDQYKPTPTGIKKKEESKKHSTEQLTKHAENTSSDQLKKIAQKKDHPHNDAAKRELERRAGEEGSMKEKRKILNDFKKEISKVLEENHYDTDNPKVQKVLDKYMEMDTNAFDSDDLDAVMEKEIVNNKGEEEKSHKVMKKMISTDFDHSSPHETMAIAKKAYAKGIPHKHIESFITKLHGSEEGEDKEWDAKAAKFAKSIIKKLPKE